MAIIKCLNCGNNVSNKAKQCPHCNSIINDTNEIENIINDIRVRTETSNNTNTKRKYNKVANKFNIVVWFIKFLGYGGGIISWIVFANLNNGWIGFVICIITCILTWFSTLLFEAIAEALNLLQEIRDK